MPLRFLRLLGLTVLVGATLVLWNEIPAPWLRGELSAPGLPAGTRVIPVTTLNAEGPGSLMEAISATGPRVIVFEVGGVIDLRSQSAARPFRILPITHGNVVIAGETAPSPGIHLVGAPLEIRASNVIVRHISVYTGTEFPYYLSADAIKIDAQADQTARNLLIENNGFYWAIDETGETWTDPNGFRPGQIKDVTFRSNIFGEALHSSLHPKGPHSNGFLISHGAQHIIFDRNLFASNFRRNPWITGDTTVVLQNNMIYNPGRHAAIFSGGPSYGGIPVISAETTAIGNICVAGQNTQAWLTGGSDGVPKMFYADPAAVAPNTKLFLQDNVFLSANTSQIGHDWDVFNDDTNTIIHATAPMYWSTLPTPLPSADVYENVLSTVGPRPWDTVRPVTSRVLAGVRNGTSKIIASESEVGGYPAMAATQRAFNAATLAAIPGGYLDGTQDPVTGGSGGAGSGGSTTNSTSPVGQWSMDGALLGEDSSGEGHALQVFGDPASGDEDGTGVGVFHIAQGDYLRGEPTSSLNVVGGESFTISAWFKATTAAPGTGDVHGIVAKSRYGRFGNATFQLYHENDVVRFTIGDRTPGPPPNTDPALTKADIVSSPTHIASGEWAHAVAWYDADADSISLSVNGEAPVTVPATFTSGFQNTSDDGYLLIGSLYNHALFDGSIDDVAMWKKVLSDTERQALFENNPHRHTTTGGGNGGGGGGRSPSGSGDTVIVDNDDGSTALAAGQFRLYRGAGYGGSLRYFPAVSGSMRTEQVSGSWFLENLIPNTRYEVFATWPANPAFTKDVPVRLVSFDSPAVTQVVDQSVAPRADLTEQGSVWQKIGELTASADGMFIVQINTLGTALDRESYTVMDAILVRPIR